MYWGLRLLSTKEIGHCRWMPVTNKIQSPNRLTNIYQTINLNKRFSTILVPGGVLLLGSCEEFRAFSHNRIAQNPSKLSVSISKFATKLFATFMYGTIMIQERYLWRVSLFYKRKREIIWAISNWKARHQAQIFFGIVVPWTWIFHSKNIHVCHKKVLLSCERPLPGSNFMEISSDLTPVYSGIIGSGSIIDWTLTIYNDKQIRYELKLLKYTDCCTRLYCRITISILTQPLSSRSSSSKMLFGSASSPNSISSCTFLKSFESISFAEDLLSVALVSLCWVLVIVSRNGWSECAPWWPSSALLLCFVSGVFESLSMKK